MRTVWLTKGYRSIRRGQGSRATHVPGIYPKEEPNDSHEGFLNSSLHVRLIKLRTHPGCGFFSPVFSMCLFISRKTPAGTQAEKA